MAVEGNPWRENQSVISKPHGVLKEDAAADFVGLSARTMQRLRQDGGGPPFVKLTERRVAYTEAALSEWLQGRTVTSTSAVTVARSRKAG